MPSEAPVVVIDTQRSRWAQGRIYGLGNPVADARVLDLPLSTWRSAATEGTGPVRGPAFVIGRDLWAAPHMLFAFANACRVHAKGPARLARDQDGPARFADPLSRLPRKDGKLLFDLWYVQEGQTLDVMDDAALEAAAGVDVTARHRELHMPADREVTGREQDLVIAFSLAAAMPVSHWVEVQRANLLALPVSVEGRRFSQLLRYLGAAARARSFASERVREKLTQVGARCRVHATAVIEGSTLGDDVEVGPGAVVRGSRISAGVRVGAQALVEASVIGAHALVQRRAMVVASVVYPGAKVGGTLQLALQGRDSSTKMFAVGTDMRLGGPVRVMTPDGLRDVDIGYQGVCFGHRSFVGSGVWIAPGRVVEAERVITRTREEMVL